MADNYYYPYGYGGYTNPYNTYGFGNYNPYSYWTTPSTTSTGTTGDTTSSLYFPTATEATQWAASIPSYQTQANILGNLSSSEGFQSYLQPYVNQMLTQLGRSGLPSSSYADRLIGNTLGNVYAQYAPSIASAWNDYNTSLANWAAGYAQYPLYMAQLLQG